MTDEPRIPTLEDMQAIAESAARAAVEASEADRARASQEGADREARSRGIELPDGFLAQLGEQFKNPEILEMIGRASASATIAELETRGAFGESETEPSREDDTESPREGDDDPTGAENIAAAGKTFAERYLGL